MFSEIFSFDTGRFHACTVVMISCHVQFFLVLGLHSTGRHGPRMLGIVGGPDSLSLGSHFHLSDSIFIGRRSPSFGRFLLAVAVLFFWIWKMDESALFGRDPSEDMAELDEWSLVFDNVSPSDRIQNSNSGSWQPTCKSAPLPAPAYRHDLSVSRVQSRAHIPCHFGGLAPPSQPQQRFVSRTEHAAGLPSRVFTSCPTQFAISS